MKPALDRKEYLGGSRTPCSAVSDVSPIWQMHRFMPRREEQFRPLSRGLRTNGDIRVSPVQQRPEHHRVHLRRTIRDNQGPKRSRAFRGEGPVSGFLLVSTREFDISVRSICLEAKISGHVFRDPGSQQHSNEFLSSQPLSLEVIVIRSLLFVPFRISSGSELLRRPEQRDSESHHHHLRASV